MTADRTDRCRADEVVDLVSALIRFDTSNTGELGHHQGRGGVRRAGSPTQLEEVGYETDLRRVRRARPGQRVRPAAGRRSRPRRAADPRPPRRGARRGRRLERAPVLRRGRGRLRLGPRRGRHEGHGRHDDRGRPALQARRASCRRATSCSRSSPTRRPAATTAAQWLVENRPDLFDGVTEAIGEVGGFSLTVPRRDGGERRLYLIETAEKGMLWMRLTRPRPRRARLDGARRQRRHRRRRGGRASWAVTSSRSCCTDSVAAVPGRGRRGDRLQLRPRLTRPRGRDRQARADRPHRRRDPARHRQPDDAQGRLQGQRHPGRPPRPCSTAGCCRAGRPPSSARSTSSSVPT